MRLLATGANGFLGSHIVDAAIKHLPHAEIIALCRYNSAGTIGWCPRHSRVKIVRGDIRDSDHIASLGATHIINAAALVSVPDSHDRPGAHWETNSDAVANMLIATRGTRFIQISTSEVFDGKEAPYRDRDRVKPITPYGGAKAAAEQIVTASGGTVARIFNMFGPRQFPRAVIPLMIRQCLEIRENKRERAELYGPVGSRAFLYAPWVAEMLVRKVLTDTRPVVQIASNEVIELKWLWGVVADLCHVDPTLIDWTPPPANANPVAQLFGTSSKGYDTRKFNKAELMKTIKWHTTNRDYCSGHPYQ